MIKILGFIAILLAIPTFGISLVVWIIIKYAYDNMIIDKIMEKVLYAYSPLVFDDRSANMFIDINSAAVPFFFDKFNGKILEYKEDSHILGLVSHPEKAIELLVFMIDTSSPNKKSIVISAIDNSKYNKYDIQKWGGEHCLSVSNWYNDKYGEDDIAYDQDYFENERREALEEEQRSYKRLKEEQLKKDEMQDELYRWEHGI